MFGKAALADVDRAVNKTSLCSCAWTLHLVLFGPLRKVRLQVKLMGLDVALSSHLRPSGVDPPCLSVSSQDRWTVSMDFNWSVCGCVRALLP